MSPLDPQMPVAQAANAFAHLFTGNHEEACLQAEEALQEHPTLHNALRAAAAANACAGRMEQSRKYVQRLLRVDPGLRVSVLMDITPLRRPADRTMYLDAMRKAGLPK
jgi:tetratricopeptide (TPR) repeat protein